MQKLTPEIIYDEPARKFLRITSGDWKDINSLWGADGSTFGGHYHKLTTEVFFVLTGALELLVLRPEKTQPGWKMAIHNEVYKAGEEFLIKPLEWHKVKCKGETRFLTILNVVYNPAQPDSYTLDAIEG